MKKLLFTLSLFTFCSVHAEQTKTIYSPFTQKLDYITALTTNSIAPGSGVTVTTTAAGVIITATGGGGGGSGSSGPAVYGALYLSSSPTQNVLTGNFTQSAQIAMNFFSTHSFVSQGVHPFEDLLIVSTPAVIDVSAYIYSTGTATGGRRFWLTVNGSTATIPFSCFDTNSIRCSFEGIFNVSAGSTITIAEANIDVGNTVTTTMSVIDAGLIIKSIGGGTSSSGGGSGTITAVVAGSGLTGGGSSGSVTLALASATINNQNFEQTKSTASPDFLQVYTSATISGRLSLIQTGTAINPLTALTKYYSLLQVVGGSFDGKTILQKVVLDDQDGNYIALPIYSLFASTDSAETTYTLDPANAGFTLTASRTCPQFSMYSNGGSGSAHSLNVDCAGFQYVAGAVTFTFPGSDGSNGQFLKTNGSGILSFATASGGSGSISTITAGTNIVVLNSTGPNVTVTLSSTIANPITFSSTTIGTFFHECFAAQATLPGTSSPFISNSTGETSAAVFFDDTSTQSATCTFTVLNYDGRPLYADLVFHSTATTGTVNFGIYTATNTPNVGGTSRDTLTFSTIVTTATVMISPAGSEMRATVALSNTTVKNRDTLTVKYERQAGSNDSAAGYARETEVIIYE